MTGPSAEYLERKRTVDDRALNRRVLGRFMDFLGRRAVQRSGLNSNLLPNQPSPSDLNSPSNPNLPPNSNPTSSRSPNQDPNSDPDTNPDLNLPPNPNVGLSSESSSNAWPPSPPDPVPLSEPIPEPVRIIEIGAGIGTMIARLVAWDCLPARVSYHAIDLEPEHVDGALDRLPSWLQTAGYDVARQESTIRARRDHRALDVTVEVGDVMAPKKCDDAVGDGPVDAVIGAAFFDLVDHAAARRRVKDWLEPNGILYAPITYDGTTAFEPSHPLDERVETCYHRHMDVVRSGGSSRTGRELVRAIPNDGGSVIACGGSDWIVGPELDGTYPAMEGDFLRDVLETIADATASVPGASLESHERESWIETRLDQLTRGELVYVAHNLDVLARL